MSGFSHRPPALVDRFYMVHSSLFRGSKGAERERQRGSPFMTGRGGVTGHRARAPSPLREGVGGRAQAFVSDINEWQTRPNDF